MVKTRFLTVGTPWIPFGQLLDLSAQRGRRWDLKAAPGIRDITNAIEYLWSDQDRGCFGCCLGRDLLPKRTGDSKNSTKDAIM